MITPSMLGRIGQNALEGWAAQAGITANCSVHDERGWDALLEVSSDGSRGPLDRAPPEMSCMVQIKTTMSVDGSEPIRLSNWQRMCTAPIPWFVLAVHVDSDHCVDGACLVHIGEEWCSRVLKRMRELSQEESVKLSDHTLSVTWSESDRLTLLHGRELLRLLRAYVGSDQHTYVSRKMQWYKDLGYEDRARRIKLSFEIDDVEMFWRNIGDVGAGLCSIMPGKWKAKVTDVRFGIEASLQDVDPSMGDMELLAPSQGSIDLKLRSNLDSPDPIRCALYRASAVFPFLPPKYDKIRLLAEYMTCVLDSSASGGGRLGRFSFELPQDQPILFSVLKVLIANLRVLFNHEHHPLTAQLIGPAGIIQELQPDGLGEINPQQVDLIELLYAAIQLLNWFEISPSTRIFIPHIVEQREFVIFMNHARQFSEGPLKGWHSKPLTVGDLYGLMTELEIFLPDHLLILLFAGYGPVTSCVVTPNGVQIAAEQAKCVIEKVIVQRNDDDKEKKLTLARATARQHLSDAGCIEVTVGHQIAID